MLACAAALLAVSASPALAQCGTNPGCTDMSISGHSEPQPIQRGELSEIILKPKNDGPGIAWGVEVHVDVPGALAIRGTRVYGGSHCAVSGTFVQCYMGDFVNQQRGEIKIEVKGTEVGTWISEARVWFQGAYDPNGGNGQVSTTTQVLAGQSGDSGGTGSPGGTGGAEAKGRCAGKRTAKAKRRCRRKTRMRRCIRRQTAMGHSGRVSRRICKRKLRD